MGPSVGANKQPKPLLSFRAVLGAQLDQTLPYAPLKRLLRALKTSSAISSYPPRASPQPLLTLSLTQPSQPLQSDSQTVSQPLQQSQNLGISQRTLSERPSRLRRKRRSSRRPRLKSASNDVQRELFLTSGSSPTPQSSLERDWSTSKVRGVDLSDIPEVASSINSHLDSLIDACPPHGIVTWPQLRNLLVGTDVQTYSAFCNYIDDVGFFDSDEPLAAGRLGSQSMKAHAYYSNLFWEQALRDFQASDPQ